MCARRTISCLFVIPGLSSSSSSRSSSTSFPQDSSRTSSSPASLRSYDTCDQAPGNRRDNPKTKKDNQQATGNRLRDLPEWLEEFTENLEDTEVPANAHISRDSDSERLTKWYRGSTILILTTRTTDVAKSASEPR